MGNTYFLFNAFLGIKIVFLFIVVLGFEGLFFNFCCVTNTIFLAITLGCGLGIGLGFTGFIKALGFVLVCLILFTVVLVIKFLFLLFILAKAWLSMGCCLLCIKVFFFVPKAGLHYLHYQ